MDVVTERYLALEYNFSAQNMTHFALKYQQLTLNSFTALNLQPRSCLSSWIRTEITQSKIEIEAIALMW